LFFIYKTIISLIYALNIPHQKEWVLFCAVFHWEFSCRISSAEVVPFELVICLPKEHAQMGATSAGRNPQSNSLENETTEYPFFRW